jgi:hypothetical protein
MTDNTADKIAKLEAEVAELKAKVSPPKSDFVPMSDAEHRDWVHQMNERRMAAATPPSVVRDWNVLPDNLVKEITLRDARAPTGPSSQGVIPSSQSVSNVHVGGKSSTSGWAREIPLSNPPGTNWVDAIAIADDVRQRAERKGKG